MTEHGIVESMEAIQALCERIAAEMRQARRSGKMMTMEGSQRMDEWSRELQQRIADLPPRPFDGIDSSELRQRFGGMLHEVQGALASAIRPPGPNGDRPQRLPKAAPGRLNAYGAC